MLSCFGINYDLIETQWNVNNLRAKEEWCKEHDLIETQWNVNEENH